MVECKCGQEFETPTQMQVHRLSGNCRQGRQLPRRPHPVGAVRRPVVPQPKPLPETYPDRHGEKRFSRPRLRWHMSISVYYEVPADYTGDETEVHDLLQYIERRYRSEIERIALDELSGVQVVQVRKGYNTDHCKLNRFQTLFGLRTKGNKQNRRQS
jgi:hypothetical protein